MGSLGQRVFIKNFGVGFGREMGHFESAKFLDILKQAKRDVRFQALGQSSGEFGRNILEVVGGEPTDWLKALARSFQDVNNELRILAEKNDTLRKSLYRTNSLIIRCNQVRIFMPILWLLFKIIL